MKVQTTEIAGVVIVESERLQDPRGSFARLYCARELASVMDRRQVVQINHSVTRAVGAVRGLHYQRVPQAEMKVVRCLKGRVFDVAVDLRQDSRTFLSWVSCELSPTAGRAFVIPEGCAHGFQVIEPESELLYLHTAAYHPDLEGGVAHDDPRVGITWPLPVADLSQRDRAFSPLAADFPGLRV